MKLKYSALFILIILTLWASSCRKDFEYASSDGNLSFSKDTVYLDTVFKNIGSSTYTLKVFNNTKDDVLIPSIKLKNGEDSFYKLNVDGKAGNVFNDVPLYAEDSLFIFIETNITRLPDATLQWLYTDVIQFDTDIHQQKVTLVTLVRDAVFLYPNKDANSIGETIKLFTKEDGTDFFVESFDLQDDELNFSNQKPYVIYGYASVPENKELVIDAGARVHFHGNSGILVKPTASLRVNGTFSSDREQMEGEVVFEGDRLEPSFSNTAGQWGAVILSEGSINNRINHLTLKNAEIGIYASGNLESEGSTLEIHNSQIYNSALHNIWAKSATITATNLLLGSAGSSSLYCEMGGRYEFTHTTIANYWNGFRMGRALHLSNHGIMGSNGGVDLIRADFRNSIIDGNSITELQLSSNQENIFNYQFQNCFLKFNESGLGSQEDILYNFDGPAYENIILNGNPDYFDSKLNDFRIGLDSDVINQGSISFAQEAPFDLLNSIRTSAPDLGVYQATVKEE